MTSLPIHRRVEVFRPYPDEHPYELLASVGEEDWQTAEFVRIAKLDGEIVAAYAMDRGMDTGIDRGTDTDFLRYRLWCLVTAPALRKQGLGRWMMGHAIGLAESKGARSVVLPGLAEQHLPRFLDHLGFKPTPSGPLFQLIQE